MDAAHQSTEATNTDTLMESVRVSVCVLKLMLALVSVPSEEPRET